MEIPTRGRIVLVNPEGAAPPPDDEAGPFELAGVVHGSVDAIAPEYLLICTFPPDQHPAWVRAWPFRHPHTAPTSGYWRLPPRATAVPSGLSAASPSAPAALGAAPPAAQDDEPPRQVPGTDPT